MKTQMVQNVELRPGKRETAKVEGLRGPETLILDGKVDDFMADTLRIKNLRQAKLLLESPIVAQLARNHPSMGDNSGLFRFDKHGRFDLIFVEQAWKGKLGNVRNGPLKVRLPGQVIQEDYGRVTIVTTHDLGESHIKHTIYAQAGRNKDDQFQLLGEDYQITKTSYDNPS